MSYFARHPTPETIDIALFKELNWTKIYHTTLVTFLWDMTLEPISKMWIRVQGKARGGSKGGAYT
jgi:hypothetical protein